MLMKDNKKKLVTVIMNRMKGSPKMEPSFSSETPQPKKMVDGAEQDNDIAYDTCCEDMMSAIKTGDSRRFKNSLKSFVSMMIDEYEDAEDQYED